MTQSHPLTIGLIGGTGMLGRALTRAILTAGLVPPERLWVSCRSAPPDADPLPAGVNVTHSNQELATACDMILLCVPPAQAVLIGIHAPDRLIVSIMAGITIKRLQMLSGATRVVRAMSSPAAARRLAYSPWAASPAITDTDRTQIQALFDACGAGDEVPDEALIDHFTAMTGPVPGFVAFFADCMVQYAVSRGATPETAERAIRQLFLAGGTMLAEDALSPADHVQQMIDYNGTTAAGLLAMKDSPISGAIAEGLQTAAAKSRKLD